MARQCGTSETTGSASLASIGAGARISSSGTSTNASVVGRIGGYVVEVGSTALALGGAEAVSAWRNTEVTASSAAVVSCTASIHALAIGSQHAKASIGNVWQLAGACNIAGQANTRVTRTAGLTFATTGAKECGLGGRNCDYISVINDQSITCEGGH